MHIFLAVTQFEGKVFGDCSLSLTKNCVALIQSGYQVMPYHNDDLYIDHSRNFCVNLFLDQDCTDIVFVDADLKFDDDAILKLMKYDKDIVAGAYRYKKDDEEYTVILDYSRNNNCKEEETGLVYATSAPTGLMRINRRVFERMIEHYDMKPDGKGVYQFFETGTRIFDDNKWWGEDSAFCKKWIDMGGEIFVEPRLTFTHIGRKDYTGNLHEYLMGRRVDKIGLDDVENGIHGWMSDVELSVLRYLASRCDSIVEIGSWKGRSTEALLTSCKGTVYAVDHWQGSACDITDIGVDLQDVYSEFVKNVGDFPNLKILKGLSVVHADMFKGMVDMVFIDAGHTYKEIKADIEAWLPKCRKIIAGHDYCDIHPDVIRAVDEKFNKVNVIGTIWFVEV